MLFLKKFRYFLLRSFSSIEREEFIKRSTPIILFTFLLNVTFLFFYFYKGENLSLGEVLFSIALFTLLNLIGSLYIYQLMIKRILYIIKGPKKALSTILLLSIPTLLPLVGLILLFNCFVEHEKKSLRFTQIFKKVLIAPLLFLLFTISIPHLRTSALIKAQLSPSNYYAIHSAADFYKIIKIKQSYENDHCEATDKSNCIIENFRNRYETMTITGTIIAIAADALNIFREKTKREKFEKNKKVTTAKAAFDLLDHNTYFLEASCNRIHPFNSLPLSLYDLTTGSFLTAASMLYDSSIYYKLRNVSKKHLTEIINVLENKDYKTREIASIKKKLNKDKASYLCR